mgnify:CR=1 FL=1
MYFVITVMLTFVHVEGTFLQEYKRQTFKDTWGCHEFIAENKMKLLAPHIIKHGNKIKGFEFYCESREAEEV